MKRVELENLSIAFDEEGEGLPMLCIHGYPLNRQIWRPQWEGLAKTCRVIAPDLRDHGDSYTLIDSSRHDAIHSMDLLAEDLARVLDAMSISEPVVINGLSMGGYVAFAFLRNYAERVRGLILTSTRARPDSEIEKGNRLKAILLSQAQGVEPIVASMLPRLVSPVTFTEKLELVERIRAIMRSSSVESIAADSMGMMNRPDARPMLQGIHVPVLIITGNDDQIIPLGEAQAMSELIPDSRLEIIEDAGHLPNMEQVELYNRLIRHYLQTLERGKTCYLA